MEQTQLSAGSAKPDERSGPITSRNVWTSWILLDAALVALVPLAYFGAATATGGSISVGDLLLCTAVAALGFLLIHTSAEYTRDTRVLRLRHFYVAKLIAMAFLLYASWIPGLAEPSAPTGYDPQRYFYEAQRLALANFDGSVITPVNYAGVIYYYAILFKALGTSAVVAALVNAFMTLASILVFMAFASAIAGPKAKHNVWLLGLILLVPETVWFDALTSRESSAMVLLALVTSTAGMYFFHTRVQSDSSAARAYTLVLVCIASTALLGLVRTSMLVVVAAAVVVVLLLLILHFPRTTRLSDLVLVAAVVALVFTVPILSERISQVPVSYAPLGQLPLVEPASSTPPSSITSPAPMQFSERSIGRLFAADSLVEAVLYAPVRVLIYVVSPLPSLTFSIPELLRGSWSAWQALMATLSALVYVGVFPLTLAGLFDIVRGGGRSRSLLLHAVFWLTMAAIAVGTTLGGVQIIQERYRVMAIPLLIGCAWLALDLPRGWLIRSYVAWAVLLCAGALFFYVYKFATPS